MRVVNNRHAVSEDVDAIAGNYFRSPVKRQYRRSPSKHMPPGQPVAAAQLGHYIERLIIYDGKRIACHYFLLANMRGIIR